MNKVEPEHTIKVQCNEDVSTAIYERILEEQYKKYACIEIKINHIRNYILNKCSQCKKEKRNCYICDYNHILKTTNAEVKFAN